MTPRFLPVVLAACLMPLWGQAPATESKPPSNKDFRSKIITVQHQQLDFLRNALRPLLSGQEGTALVGSQEGGLRLLSVRDFPENIAAIEEAVKRLDQPTKRAESVELHFHVLFAHKAAVASEGFPEEIQDVLKGLRSSLAYRSFTPVASFVQRVSAEGGRINGDGVSEPADGKGDRLGISWEVSRVQVNSEGNLLLNGLEVLAIQQGTSNKAHMRSDVTLKVGEKVVVGTTVMKDKGLVVVLLAKRIP